MLINKVAKWLCEVSAYFSLGGLKASFCRSRLGLYQYGALDAPMLFVDFEQTFNHTAFQSLEQALANVACVVHTKHLLEDTGS